MAVNEMVYNGKVFTKIRKGGAKCNKYESISLSSLPVDTLTVTVVDERHWGFPLANADDQLLYICEGYPIVTKLSDENLGDYQYGSVVRYYHSGNLVGKFYLEKIEQIGKWDWKFSCVSDMGMLVSSDHYGGLYTGQKAKDVIADVIGGVIPYTLEESLQNVEIYGWLKKASRRDNLRDVLFAIGAQVVRDANGEAVFQPYEAEPHPYAILPSTFYKTGSSVNNGTPATQAILTEHAYAARTTDETETLYDGEIVGEDLITPKGAKVNGIIVVFDEPHYDLEVSSAQLLEYGVNYAVLGSSAYGSLIGKKYTHTQRTLVRDGKATGVPNVVRSSKCTLVNIRNSPSVADRLIAFYGYATKVTVDMVITTEKPGDFVSFIDPYGRPMYGYIQSLEITMSKVMKARATIICGFIPPVDVPMYLHHEFFFSNATWTVPEGVTSVRVVCIGGGPGGPSGAPGGSGKIGRSYTLGPHKLWGSNKYYYQTYNEIAPGMGGEGGAGSEGAEGGKVYSNTIKVTPGQQIAIVIGQGGEGGVCDGTNVVAGNPGTATTFGDLSSESGASIPNGYLEEITGKTYAGKGETGVAGGAGVSCEAVDVPDEFWGGTTVQWNYIIPAGVAHKGVTTVPGMEQSSVVYKSTEDVGSMSSSSGMRSWYYGRGLGGGAAAGANGPSATERLGATGATPVAPDDQTIPGNGGHGGHGGGGAGGAGGAQAETRRYEGYSGSNATVSQVSPTAGGPGGKGGKGGPGACFIYYYSPEEPTA